MGPADQERGGQAHRERLRAGIRLAAGGLRCSARSLHLRTFGPQAEKFAYSAYVPPRPLRISGPGPVHEGESWGIGGSVPWGVMRAAGPVSREAAPTGLRRIVAVPSEEFGIESTLGPKGKVYDADGRDVRLLRSSEFGLSDQLQRKRRVPEEMRTEQRTIDRPAPPGMKGFLGPEYWNDYWKLDGVVVRTRMKPSRDDLTEQALRMAAERGATLGKTKSFAEKRVEEAVSEEQELVRTLRLAHDSIYGDEGGYASSDDEERVS